MSITLSALQKQRTDTAASWTANNPTLLSGELGFESDTGYWKVGDGSTAWTSLAYIGGTKISAYPLVNADIDAAAEIAVSKLADGDARQLLQTDAAGTGVEWASNIDIPGTLDVTGVATFDGSVTVEGDLTVNAQSEVRWADADSSNWVAFQAPATVASNVTWTLPDADGSSGQILSTNGTGTLSWTDDSGAIIVDGGNFNTGGSAAATSTTIDGGSFN